MTDTQTLMQFPCDFPLKIIGKNSDRFLTEIEQIVRKHFTIIDEVTIQNNLSQNGNYLAITATIRVYNQASLDGLYMELTKHPDIKMVL
ncbi:MAG: DUF493 domain-containing protein [Legionellaceae bacterium]|nr:DUF493 domain-containing protein [Legionellaceae bacterium]